MRKEEKDDLFKRVENLDKGYFGSRDVEQLVRAMADQVASMQKLPTISNVHKQACDLVFVLASFARNHGRDLDQMLEDAVLALELRRRERHYYEVHVNLEPIAKKDRLMQLQAIAKEFGFRVAKLEMRKRPNNKLQRVNDAFCTARGISKADLCDRTVRFLKHLEAGGFDPTRFKLEGTIFDSRYDDSMYRLKRYRLSEKERNPLAPAPGALAGRKDP